jgi:hypothetical protein
MPSDSVRLKGPALKEIWAKITEAFEAAEIKRILRFTTDLRLDQEVKDSQNFDGLVFDLMERLEQRGLIYLFLRGVYDARPNLKDLRDAIEKNCPEALQTGAGVTVEAKRAAVGVEAVKDQLSDPKIRDLVTPHREELESLMDGVEVLANYKGLHDIVQTIQWTHQPQMASDMQRLRNDEVAGTTLDAHVFQLDELCANAFKAAEALPDTGAMQAAELRWINKLKLLIDQIRLAIEKLDDREGGRAMRAMRSLLRPESNRINSLLFGTAERLPLERLVSTVEEVLQATSSDGLAPAEMRDALQSLKGMLPQLKGRAIEHNQWQEVEMELFAAGDFIEQGTAESIQDFQDTWAVVKLGVAALAAPEPQAPWVLKSQNLAAAIDAVLPADMARVQSNFALFRHTVLFHFFQVDRALRSQCQAILVIRAPLKSLLKEV